VKPIDFADLEATVAKALRHVAALREARAAAAELQRQREALLQSEKMAAFGCTKSCRISSPAPGRRWSTGPRHAASGSRRGRWARRSKSRSPTTAPASTSRNWHACSPRYSPRSASAATWRPPGGRRYACCATRACPTWTGGPSTVGWSRTGRTCAGAAPFTGDTLARTASAFLASANRPVLEKPVAPEEVRRLVAALAVGGPSDR
jgi:hypothetical protein